MANKQHRDNGGDTTCSDIALAILLVIAAMVAINAIAVQIATHDNEPPPSCQHFPVSLRCVRMDSGSCLEECRPPRLATYITRKTKAEVATAVMLYLGESALDSAFSEDEAEADAREWSNRFWYGTDIALALMASERTHFSNCVAACMYHHHQRQQQQQPKSGGEL
jgi:hypothetical protein